MLMVMKAMKQLLEINTQITLLIIEERYMEALELTKELKRLLKTYKGAC